MCAVCKKDDNITVCDDCVEEFMNKQAEEYKNKARTASSDD